MPIDVNRHFNAVVAKLVTDIGERLTGLDQKARVRVPKIVNPDPPQTRFLQSLVEDPPPPVIHIDESPNAICEYPLGLLLWRTLTPRDRDHNHNRGCRLILERLQSLGELQAHIDSSAFAVLGGLDSPSRDPSLDGNESPVEVDVTPLEGEGLTDPKPGPGK